MAPDIRIDVQLDEQQWGKHLAEQTREGLISSTPWMPPVWFYDERGSDLFDQITRLPEYYPTEAEREILAAHSDEIATITDANTLVELGSGTSDKTRLLIDALRRHGSLQTFGPMDCAESTLREASEQIAAQHPGLGISGLVGDFNAHLAHLPRGGNRLIAFLGSTIGNFNPEGRAAFLAHLGSIADPGDYILLGTDLVKSESRLEDAYNDSQGVTAEFNLNALAVMNRELDADFDLAGFKHHAPWVADKSRIEMRLIALGDQHVSIPGLGITLAIADGEWIQTEVSTKFTAPQVASELAGVGLDVVRQWTDPAGDFLVTLARAPLA